MITLIEGAPRSGKTYYAVNEVLKKYYVFSEEDLVWKCKSPDEVVIYSNVDLFRMSESLFDAINKAGGLNPFFTKNYQAEFTREKRHIYIIDEAQGPDLFHRKFYDQRVFEFFQVHGHYRIDIFLITQDIKSLVPELRGLPEYYINVPRRSYAYGKEFRYHFMVGNEIFRRRTLRKDLRVFSAYRSTVDVEGQKATSFTRKYYIYVGVFVFIAVVGFCVILKYRFSPPSDTVKIVKAVEGNKNCKIIALYGDNALVKNLADKKLLRVSYNNITGDLRIGAMVNVSM
ncbi:MAG: hypothetical protein FJ264_17665 [Planctomycetes bacterium]|nr:hypothetical protein [Planctomycetota bacterium]